MLLLFGRCHWEIKNDKLSVSLFHLKEIRESHLNVIQVYAKFQECKMKKVTVLSKWSFVTVYSKAAV